ncbi:hypothetical protein GCM10009104_17200 [Marinobacterium maritimum]|uniref:Uncharacterized protein n=1 Tax=Marinobacterium maritimum TaxID=500162 RepID=A0ABN1I5Y2_9GAMM
MTETNNVSPTTYSYRCSKEHYWQGLCLIVTSLEKASLVLNGQLKYEKALMHLNISLLQSVHLQQARVSRVA